jgi:hypothetical protein
VKPFLMYSVARLLLFVAVAALLYALNLRGLLLGAVALLVTLPLSYVLLARLRNAFAQDVERRVSERRERQADLRARLRGDDEAGAPDTP